MTYKHWIAVGVLLIIIGIAFGVYGAKAEAEGPVWYIEKHCTKQGQEGPAEVYNCSKRAADFWFDFHRTGQVEESTHDTRTGTYYFRFKKYLVSVKDNTDGTAKASIEDHSRLRSGHFVYLGPGFGPSSPRSSSGGSSGSGGGVK